MIKSSQNLQIYIFILAKYIPPWAAQESRPGIWVASDKSIVSITLDFVFVYTTYRRRQAAIQGVDVVCIKCVAHAASTVIIARLVMRTPQTTQLYRGDLHSARGRSTSFTPYSHAGSHVI